MRGRAVTLALVCAAFAVGCGDDEQPEAQATTTVTVEREVTPTVEPEPGPEATTPTDEPDAGEAEDVAARIEREPDGDHVLRVDSEAEGDAACEALQAQWPDSVDSDVVFVVVPSGENYASCGKP